MALELTTVDAFTDTPFAGNPAAIAILDSFPPDSLMQAVALEMNLSETAYVVRRGDGDHDLRWFTPTVEVDLCGHATLAAAHLLGGRARFHTRSGLLQCAPADDGWIEMDFPADRPVQVEPPVELGLPGMVWFGTGRWDALAELREPSSVRNLVPDLTRIAATGKRLVIVTAAGDRPGIDFVSRVFAPNTGIPEDPVTGSAHCTLAAHWGRRLGREVLVGEQASPRGGTVRTRLNGDRVVLAGQAVTMAHVTLTI
ncbi:MAG TPA: PhzF family phenazine biosynthesis protein [Acidimicrobiales bacterium]|nr:PhzF family phenazine biosynthesis protein [Acidimicrobiales bacterium]